VIHSARNDQFIDEESTGRMGFSAGNNQLMEADSERQDQNARKILKAVTISGSATTTPINYTTKVNFLKNSNSKMSLK
jgi:hypothetical protein